MKRRRWLSTIPGYNLRRADL